jgi:hypothetical protein
MRVRRAIRSSARPGCPVRGRHPEEEAEHGPEVGDEVVCHAECHQALADRLEVLYGGGLQGQMVQPAAAEHRRLAVGLGVPLYFEDVQLGPVADLDDGESGPLPVGQGLRPVPDDVGVEDVAVEVVQAGGVVGDDGDVVETLEQHGRSLSPDVIQATTSLVCRTGAMVV